jgi:hypothetical protein
MIIKHYTSIHTIIHGANDRAKLEQYTKQLKRFENLSKRYYEHIDAKCTHNHRSYGERETITGCLLYKSYMLGLFCLKKPCEGYSE